jgi:hypothetical protein
MKCCEYSFGNWLDEIGHKYRIVIRAEARTIIWLLLLCRNDKLLNGGNNVSLTSVGFVHRYASDLCRG